MQNRGGSSFGDQDSITYHKLYKLQTLNYKAIVTTTVRQNKLADDYVHTCKISFLIQFKWNASSNHFHYNFVEAAIFLFGNHSARLQFVQGDLMSFEGIKSIREHGEAMLQPPN